MPAVAPLPLLPTFRDPAGSLQLTRHSARRTVHPPYDTHILAFLATPLADTLVAEGKLIPTTVLSPGPSEDPGNNPDASPVAELVLQHPRIPFASYPWEWSPAMWCSAAELTLDLCTRLLDQGYILKDATPLNILFRGNRPIFVDILSIAPVDLSQPIWFAYAQFVRTFLLPLLAHAQLGWPLEASLNRRDGYQPEEIYAALPWQKRLQQPARSAVTLPILFAKQKSMATKPFTASDPELTRHILLKTLSNLRAQIHKVTPTNRTSHWTSYTTTATHYSPHQHDQKRDFVTAALIHASPQRVLDIGCNTGTYSLLAANAGASVVSIDTDLHSVDKLYTRLRADSATQQLDILPLHLDLAYPSPATGWKNRESASFLARASGHFDTVLMLAVLHHLLITSHIPLQSIANLTADLTTHHLILEWVPPTDPMFQQLLHSREAIFAHITEAAFRLAFSAHFATLREETLENGRILFLFQKLSPTSQE